MTREQQDPVVHLAPLVQWVQLVHVVNVAGKVHQVRLA